MKYDRRMRSRKGSFANDAPSVAGTSTDGLLGDLNKKLTRRQAIGTTGKVAIGAVVAAVIAGGATAAYYSQAPRGAVTSSTSATTSASTSATTSAAAGDIPVGFIGEITGTNYFAGEELLAGTQLAVNMINSSGGILGRQIHLVIGDNQSDPAVAKTVVTRMIEQDHIVALVGEYFSYMARAYIDVVSQAGIPFMQQSTSADDLRKRQDRNCFFFIAPNSAMSVAGRNLIIQLYQLGKVKNVQLVYSTDESGKNLNSVYEEALGKAGVPYVTDGMDVNTQDFTSTILKWKGATPRAELLVSVISTASEFMLAKQGYSAGLMPSAATPYALDANGVFEVTPELWSLIGPAGRYWTSVDFILPLKVLKFTPLGQEFDSAYRKTYGMGPNNMSFCALDSITALANAIKTAGSTDSNAIIEGLRTMNIPGGIWNLQFPETPGGIWWHTPNIPSGDTQFQELNQDYNDTPAIFPPQIATAPLVTPGHVADVDFRNVTVTTTY